MYSPSDLFTKSYNYAKTHYDKVAILSAKYGLLFPDDMIDPYNKYLPDMKDEDRRKWADGVFHQLIERISLKKGDVVYFHAGMKYREYLIPKLKELKIEVAVPLQGLRFGFQKKWYITNQEKILES